MPVPLPGRTLTARRQRVTARSPLRATQLPRRLFLPHPPQPAAAPVALPTLTVEAGFASEPGVSQASTTWTDITPWARSINTNLGRSPEASDFAAGTASLVLDNKDRRFDPTNTASPYAPNVLPMRRIRARATVESETYPLFSGYTTGWPLSPSPPGKHDITITTIDGTEVLSLAQLPSVWALEVAADDPDAWWRFAESAGTILADSSGNAIHGAYTSDAGELTGGGLLPYDNDGKSLSLRGTQQYAASVTNTAVRRSGGAFSFEVWLVIPSEVLSETDRLVIYQQGKVSGANGFLFWFERLSPGGSIRFVMDDYDTGVITSDLTATLSADQYDRPLHIVVTWDTSALRLYFDGSFVDGGGVTVWNATATPNVYIGGHSAPTPPILELGWKGSIAELAVYGSALSATRIIAHYNAAVAPWDGDTTPVRLGRVLDLVGWPAAERTIDPSTFTLGPEPLSGDSLSILRRAVAAEGGRLFIGPDGYVTFHSRDHETLTNDFQVAATWGDGGGGEHPYERSPRISFDRDRIINKVTGRRVGGLEITLVDTASKSAFLERAADAGEVPAANDDDVRALLQAVLDTSAQPQMRVEPFTVRPLRQSGDMWRRVLGSRIGQHHVVVNRPPAGAPIEVHGRVEQIGHRLHPGSVASWEEKITLGPAKWVAAPTVRSTSGAAAAGATRTPAGLKDYSAYLYLTANQTLGALGTFTKVTWGAILYDRSEGAVNLTNDEYTVPVGGLWSMKGGLHVQAAAGERFLWSLYVDGTETSRAFDDVAGGTLELVFSWEGELLAGAVCDMRWYQANGTLRAAVAGSQFTWWTVRRVR